MSKYPLPFSPYTAIIISLPLLKLQSPVNTTFAFSTLLRSNSGDISQSTSRWRYFGGVSDGSPSRMAKSPGASS